MKNSILIVEDDADVRFSLAQTLRSHGYEVREACDGQEAISTLRDTPRPGMILMDLMMPGMDGWSLRAHLLRDPLLSSIPLVVISGGSNVPRAASSLHAVAYLEKPFPMEKFVRVVDEFSLDAEAQAARDHTIIGTMSGAVTRLTGLIEALLQEATIVDDELVTKTETVDLVALCQEIVGALRPLAKQRDVSLELSLPTDIPPMQGDAGLVRLIVHSLLVDALKTREAGTVELALAFEDNAHELQVRDWSEPVTSGGQTISTAPALRDDSQAPLSQQPSAWDIAPGSKAGAAHVPGLSMGLSLVREILTSVKGHVEVRSDLDAGTCFVLVLPQR